MTYWELPSSFATLSWMIHKTVKSSSQELLIYGRRFILNRKLQFLYCVCVCVCVCARARARACVCARACTWETERLLYKNSFKLAHRKKYGTVRSGERIGNGIPNTWKCFSSLVKTPHTPPIHCHRTGFEMARHHFLLGLQTLSHTTSRSTKVRCETCQSAPHHPVRSYRLNLNYFSTCGSVIGFAAMCICSKCVLRLVRAWELQSRKDLDSTLTTGRYVPEAEDIILQHRENFKCHSCNTFVLGTTTRFRVMKQFPAKKIGACYENRRKATAQSL